MRTQGGTCSRTSSWAELLLAHDTTDALITDFTIPGMTWLDLIREVRTCKPTLPTILLTGRVGDIATASIDRAVGGRVIVLQKAGAHRRTDRSARRRDRRSRGLIGHARVIGDLCLGK
jgi:FixJ family two-component response regulator